MLFLSYSSHIFLSTQFVKSNLKKLIIMDKGVFLLHSSKKLYTIYLSKFGNFCFVSTLGYKHLKYKKGHKFVGLNYFFAFRRNSLKYNTDTWRIAVSNAYLQLLLYRKKLHTVTM